MAFPTSPVNGQQANINGITYTYSNTIPAWTVATSLGNAFVSVSATGNVSGGNILTSGVMSSTGNAIHGNILIGGLLSATGNLITSSKVLNNSGNPILQQTGSVLQVVQAVKVDSFSSTANTWTDVTGISVSITPTSSTSKVLVTCDWSAGMDTATTPDIMARLMRGTTAIALGNTGGTDYVTAMPISGTQGQYTTFNNSVTYLDSPATTSATTYKLQMRNWSNTTTWYVGQRGLNGSFIIPSFITVMEIAA